MNIKNQLNTHLQVIDEVLQKFPWQSREHYAWFLSQTYYYVRHSTRLLALASSRFDFTQTEQHYALAAHISGETRHELLAVNDLKALGFAIKDYPELPETRSWYHAQYYYIQNIHPCALLGTMLSLEGLAVFKGPWLHDKVAALYGRNTGTFLKVHGAEDVEHVEADYKVFEKLSADQQKIVLESLEQSVWSYCQILSGIQDKIARERIPLKPKIAA